MPKYTRVKDKNTGHEYDVLASRVDEKKHTVVDRKNTAPVSRPRAPKHNVKSPKPKTDAKTTESTEGAPSAS